MNNLSIKLLSILSGCNPKDEVLSKESKMQSIIHSKDYSYLAAMPAFSQYFNDLFSQTKLRSYSEKELSAVIKVLPEIPNLLEDLAFSLVNGCAPELVFDDRPDFMDIRSIRQLSEKLKTLPGAKNYCNIQAQDLFEIFNPDTVKDIHDDFYKLPSEYDDFESALRTLYSGKKYCISSMEVKAKELEYEKKISEYTTQIDTGKRKKKTRVFVKVAIAMLCTLIPLFIARYTSLLSSAGLLLSIIVELILAIAFIVRG